MHDEETLQNLHFDEELKMINICAVGPLRVSSALVNAGLMKNGSKIVMITSQGGSVSWQTTQNPNGHDYGHHVRFPKHSSVVCFSLKILHGLTVSSFSSSSFNYTDVQSGTKHDGRPLVTRGEGKGHSRRRVSPWI